jgi:hypothetical protein
MTQSSGSDGPRAAAWDAPTMPVVAPDELWIGSPFALVDGDRFTIGWQNWPDDKGGPAFVTIRRTSLGSLKVAERFPFTPDGWAAAWHALVRLDSGTAEHAARVLAQRVGPASSQDERKELDAQTLAYLPRMTFLGGYVAGADLAVRSAYGVRFMQDRVAVFTVGALRPLAVLSYPAIQDVEVGGPGLVRTGGGFVGGGVGTIAAAEGMTIAAVLNALTTRTRIKTVLRIQAGASEVFFLNTETEPEQLRIQLSRALGAIREIHSANTSSSPARTPSGVVSLVDELSRLSSLLENGLLTREEFDTLKAQLMAGS